MACKHLTGPLLRWLERLPTPLAHVLFLTAYVASAFPVMVGMMVLNLAGGYLFGLAHGLALCLSGGVLGALVATEACRHACRAPVIRLQRDYENLKQVRACDSEETARRDTKKSVVENRDADGVMVLLSQLL